MKKFQRVIVTSGPTKEWIDPVRFITNASTGKMGYCIASEFNKNNFDTVYIHGPVEKQYSNITNSINISVETNLEMRNAIIENLQENTILIMAAAPCDFIPILEIETKIKKKDLFTLEMKKNIDILFEISQYVSNTDFKNITLVGFSAETENLIENAKQKLVSKKLDYIIGNYVGKKEKGFGDINSSIVILDKNGNKIEFGPAKKEIIAKHIMKYFNQTVTLIK